jgi:hypothetical protein
MRGIIYYDKLETGLAEFKKIIEDYANIGITCDKPVANANQARVTFNNGDEWIVVRATDSARGHSCNVAYIDRMIPDDFVETIIMPTIKAFPYQAYRYYNWGTW